MDPELLTEYKGAHSKAEMVSPSLHSTNTAAKNDARYNPVPATRDGSADGYEMSQRNYSRPTFGRDESKEWLISGAASIGGRERSVSPSGDRAPKLPEIELRSYR